MTAPRQVLPGTVYLVTRRCARRQFFLKPGRTTNQVFLYLLALAAQRSGVQVHAYCVLSNHFHLIVTDPDARLPAFEQYLDSLVARVLNRALGRAETFWGPNSYSAVALTTPLDVLDKAAYVLANPVAAGLVRRGREWPGLWSAPEWIGGSALRAPRPKFFFGSNSYLPEVAWLQLVPPPGFESAEEFQRALGSALAEREAKAAEGGRRFMGVVRVLAQNPYARPHSARQHSKDGRGALNPRVAALDKWKRIEALKQLVEFLRAYREAWLQLRRGVAGVVFPAGTYHLRVEHGVACAPCG